MGEKRTAAGMAKNNQPVLHNRFKLLKILGKGGMGEIYLAEDLKLKRKVAVKKISSEAISGSSAKARFLREAQTASQLEHANICTIYEIFEEDENDYIVMQYVEGITLGHIIKMKRLGIGEILDIAVQICSGMAEANAKGIIHRDLKPGNIMIDRRGIVKILDFGLAKIKDRSEKKKKGTVENNLTEKGYVMGTVSYMSPEQARGQTLDARTDIFSFGCILFEMLEGTDPFHDKEKIAVLYKILNKEVEFSQRIPDRLKEIVSKALAKAREKRYADFFEMKEALEDFRRQYKEAREKNLEKEQSDSDRSQTANGENLVGIVGRVRELKATTDPFSSKHKKSIRLFLILLGLLAVAAALFFFISGQRPAGSIGCQQDRFYIYLHPFENNTEEEGLAEMAGYLLCESLNQFEPFKVITRQEAAPVLTGGAKNAAANITPLLEKFKIKYELKGKISKIKSVINIEAVLHSIDKDGKGYSITVPGLQDRDSLLIHQIDTLTRQVYDKLFPEKGDNLRFKKISGIFGTSWEQFSLFYEGLRHFKKLEASKAVEYFRKSQDLLASKLYLANVYIFANVGTRAVKLIDEIFPRIDYLTKSLKLKALAIQAKFNVDFRQRIHYLEELKNEFPFSKEAFFELGEAYFQRGNAGKALNFYKQAIELNPHYSQAINHLGYCCSHLGDHRQAIEFFEDYRDLDRSANSFDSLGDGYFYAGDYISAEACKRAAISMDEKSSVWSYLTLTNIYIIKAEFGAAEKALGKFNELMRIPQVSRFSLVRQAFIHYINREYEKALDMVNQSLDVFDDDDLNRNSAEAHWLKGVILLSLYRLRESRKELLWLKRFKEKYKLSEENFFAPFKYFIHLQALILEKEGAVGRADRTFRFLIDMKTQLSYRTTYYNCQFFHTGYARFLVRSKKHKQAFSEINRCLEFNRNYLPALWLKAEILENWDDPARFPIYRKIANLYGEADEENYLRNRLKEKIRQ
jgi:serine/threonine protein kinase/Tfp pilus assembly protein PilF